MFSFLRSSRSVIVLTFVLFLYSVSFSSAVNAQTGAKTVTGTVMSQTGDPLSGATINAVGSGIATTTDATGKFRISMPQKIRTLKISYVGMEDKEVSVTDQTNVNVSLNVAKSNLNEIVVIGYGTQKKKSFTGAVATFNAENLDERPVTRVDQALVGQMAGVAVKQTSGALGKGMSIQIRGTGSISAGNEPLYVIDGFPLSTATPNGSGNFATGNPLDNINPNDIESIQVLKDAASGAIYGSRAANGVVIITTKRGKMGKARINLNTYAGFSERSRKLDMLNGAEWIDRATEIINAQWVASGPGRTASQTNEQRRIALGLLPGQVNTSYMTDDRWTQPGYPGLRIIDWQDEAFRKGLVQNYQLSASGATDAVRYYVSGNFVRQEGMVIGTDYTAYSARGNVEVNITKKLKAGLNLAPTYSLNNDPGVEGKDNILHQMVSFTPVQEDTMGLDVNIGNNGTYRWSTSANSPIARLKNVVGLTKRFRTIASVFAEYQIIPGLIVKSTVNLDNTDNTAKGYTPYRVSGSQLTRQAQLTVLTSGSYNTYRRQNFVQENTVSYNKLIKDVHDVSVVAGTAYNVGKFDNSNLSSNGGFSNNAITTLNAANGITGGATETRNVLISYFGRIQYSYNNKYLLSVSARTDGSSRFGSDTRWGNFPSASVGWRVSQEKFMRDIPWLSELKLRASYGKSGNYNIGDYSHISVLGTYNYTFNNTTAIGQAPSGIANPGLQWEKSETLDIGLDLAFFRNRITAAFDYYNKLNTELLLHVPIPNATGFGTFFSNAGSVRNKGWELELTSRNTTGKFQWSTTANLSHNANKVVALPGGQNQLLIPSSFDIPHSILRIGDPMYSIYVVKMLGTLSADDISKGAPLFGSQTVGDPKYFDANSDGVIDANDRVIVGHPTPDYVWGITNNFRYKGFDLSVLVQGQWGGSMYSLLGRALGRTGQGASDNALGTYRNRWRSPDNPGEGRVSKAYSTFGRIVNTDWLYPSDYYRVRNISLGYDLTGVVKRFLPQGGRIYITAENFFGHDEYVGGFNPEAANTDLSGSSTYPEPGDYGGLPLAKSLILGLNINF